MKTRFSNFFYVMCFSLIAFSGCSNPTFNINFIQPTPTKNLPVPNWIWFSSYFTSDEGRLEYNLQYPEEWYLYPGLTESVPGLEGETLVQSFARVNGNFEYQPPDSIKIKIYALPCNLTQEKCEDSDQITSPVTESLQGVKTIQYLAGDTVWNVFIYAKNYRFMLQGYLKGEHSEYSEQIALLEKIASTLEIK